ncbi:hypothetical protein [Pseudaminobacter soli (ex Li et al. 2025)]|uniref:Uncharacterized protein n=1 Tax=Pseudaminobacter soli (ex Li et al. 2025) TaxID=1295366 RepID=A0A2P7S6N4_9HYPH|nr:hypothetical protein [Mesorhizobium soli]PSJ58138.1 hypothetical protein C7I85_19905 [Mesorhizobium soli]
MFYPFAKGPDAPSELPSYLGRRAAGGLSRSECKLTAWALAMGARVPLEHPYEGRRRRGSLPDIDPWDAGPVPGHRSPLRRLIGWLGEIVRRAAPSEAPVTTMSGAMCERVGAAAGISYIGEADSAAKGRAGEAGEIATEDACERPLKRAA